jgi:general secretion pathway protein H
MHHRNGFTLIELLVVVSIIAIAFTAFITLGFSFSNPADKLDEDIRRLQARLEFAHEQAVTRSEEYGVRFNTQSYRFMRLDKDKWVDITDDKLLAPRELDDNIEFEVALEKLSIVLTKKDAEPEEDNPESQIKPQVFLLSSGEATPDFEVRVRIAGQDLSRALHGDINGQYTLLKDNE